jgi:hypothetical protein
MVADWHDWKHLDRPTDEPDIEAESPDISGELPHIPTVGNAMGSVGSKGAIDDALNLNRMSGRSGAVSSVGTRAVSPMQVFISPDDDRRAGACTPLTPGGEATGSRVNGFR